MNKFNELLNQAIEYKLIGTIVRIYFSNENDLYAVIGRIAKISKQEIVVSTSEVPQVGLPKEYRTCASLNLKFSTIKQIEGTDL